MVFQTILFAAFVAVYSLWSQEAIAAPLNLRDDGVGVLDIFIPPNRKDDQYYDVNIDFGGQVVPCLLDTGSADLFAAATGCSITDPNSGCYNLNVLYDINNDTNIVSNETFFTTVGEGSVWGNQSLMDIGLGGITAKALATGLVTNAVRNEFQGGSFAGLIGLSMIKVSRQWYFNARLPLMDSLITGSVLKKPLFSISLPRLGDPDSLATGSLTIGDIEPQYAGLDITYGDILNTPNYNEDGFPPEPQGWIVQLEGIRMNGQEVNMSAGLLDAEARYMSLFDTGAQNLAFRYPDFNAIAALFRGPTIVQEGHAVYFDCSIPQLLELKYNGQWFPIDPLDLIIPSSHRVVNGTELCQSALSTWSRTFADSIIGVPFLRSAFSVYDYVTTDMFTVKPRVGLASLVDAGAAMSRYADLYKNRLL